MSAPFLLSVIIPTRDRPDALAAVLESLSTQNPAAFPWEVVVVDNGSGDATEQVVLTKQSAFPVPVRYVAEPRPGLHHARHSGAQAASGRFLGFLDDDVITAQSWVGGVHRLATGEAHAIAGRVLPRWDCPPPRWLLRMPTCLNNLSLLDEGRRSKQIEAERAVGCNLMIGKQTLYELGGFHPDAFPPALLRYRGDGETGLMKKFAQRRLRCVYEPTALVWHCITAARVGLEYHVARAFSQGVSHSYTEVRAAHGLDVLERQPQDGVRRPAVFKLVSAFSPSGPIARRLRTSRARIFYRMYRAQLVQIEAGRKRGFDFHQQELERDPELLAYVLQDGYLE